MHKFLRAVGFYEIKKEELEQLFKQIIEQGTAIVDIGGGSIQVSLFDKDTLITTQNMRLGVLRLRERLTELKSKTNHYEDLIADMANPHFTLFKKMYLKNREIKNIILDNKFFSRVGKCLSIFRKVLCRRLLLFFLLDNPR